MWSTRKDPESEWLARDNLETNPITIKPRLGATLQSSPPGFPCPPALHPGALPDKSLLLCQHMCLLEKFISQVLDKSPLLGSGRGPSSCNRHAGQISVGQRGTLTSGGGIQQHSERMSGGFCLWSPGEATGTGKVGTQRWANLSSRSLQGHGSDSNFDAPCWSQGLGFLPTLQVSAFSYWFCFNPPFQLLVILLPQIKMCSPTVAPGNYHPPTLTRAQVSQDLHLTLTPHEERQRVIGPKCKLI